MARSKSRAAWCDLSSGWDQGCLGMAKGEVRQIVIPAAEGYGDRGFPAWGIPVQWHLRVFLG